MLAWSGARGWSPTCPATLHLQPLQGTYYGFRDRGFGHCSFHFHGFGKAPAYAGVPLAINAAQYTGTSICGLCVRFRGTGSGAGGNPISADWQPGFIW